MSINLLDEALALAQKGFRVVPANGKAPFIKNWTEKATTKENGIKKMWGIKNYNIAIATGDDLVVIDCDIKDDCNGLDNFHNFLKDNEIELPKTLSSTTGRGGKHYYFRTNAEIESSSNKFLDGVDIRGKGGCVIAPPSLHANGNRYTWDNDYEIAQLPLELEMLFSNDTNISKKEYKNISVINEGDRNNTMFRLSCKLVEDGLAQESIIKAIESENSLKCSPPLKKDELMQIVNSSFRYGIKNKKINSMSKIFSGEYNTTTISIYWLIWYLSLSLCKDTIYVTQQELCKYLGIKDVKTFRNNIKPLVNKLIKVDKAKNYNGGFPINSYKIM